MGGKRNNFGASGPYEQGVSLDVPLRKKAFRGFSDQENRKSRNGNTVITADDSAIEYLDEDCRDTHGFSPSRYHSDGRMVANSDILQPQHRRAGATSSRRHDYRYGNLHGDNDINIGNKNIGNKSQRSRRPATLESELFSDTPDPFSLPIGAIQDSYSAGVEFAGKKIAALRDVASRSILRSGQKKELQDPIPRSGAASRLGRLGDRLTEILRSPLEISVLRSILGILACIVVGASLAVIFVVSSRHMPAGNAALAIRADESMSIDESPGDVVGRLEPATYPTFQHSGLVVSSLVETESSSQAQPKVNLPTVIDMSNKYVLNKKSRKKARRNSQHQQKQDLADKSNGRGGSSSQSVTSHHSHTRTRKTRHTKYRRLRRQAVNHAAKTRINAQQTNEISRSKHVLIPDVDKFISKNKLDKTESKTVSAAERKLLKIARVNAKKALATRSKSKLTKTSSPKGSDDWENPYEDD